MLGGAIQLDKPATVAIVDTISNKAIIYRSTKQLLGKNYYLLNRQRQQKHILSHQRNVAQRHHANNKFGESELGQHIDRLLAKAIIKLAKEYQVASIVVPKIDNIREIIQTDEVVFTVMQKEIKDFFLGLSKLTLKMSLNKYFSLQSFNDHFEMGWVERLR